MKAEEASNQITHGGMNAAMGIGDSNATAQQYNYLIDESNGSIESK